ncbi:hypothetical protein GY45DRAFT_512312 [Cubamyces sp. BRFM 1775]|nr:hypothetical protein GY45DRAFT_512312 [Cubamyces sp. BRFM 1775]
MRRADRGRLNLSHVSDPCRGPWPHTGESEAKAKAKAKARRVMGSHQDLGTRRSRVHTDADADNLRLDERPAASNPQPLCSSESECSTRARCLYARARGGSAAGRCERPSCSPGCPASQLALRYDATGTMPHLNIIVAVMLSCYYAVPKPVTVPSYMCSVPCVLSSCHDSH